MHTQIGILEMFLVTMFHPQDSHCIHVDTKASSLIHNAVRRIVQCHQHYFPMANIFMTPRAISVSWGHASVLDADIICLRELDRQDKNWKMFINSAGTELPLLNHFKLRQRLRTDRGRNFLDFSLNVNPERQAIYPKNLSSSSRTPAFPCKLQILKGTKNVALTRAHADFHLNHIVAQTFYNWLINTQCPDEHYFSTLGSLNISKSGNNEYILEQRFDQERYRHH